MGRWAWMIRDERGRVMASDDDYYEASLAMEAATNQLNLMQETERRKRGSGR